MFRILWCICVVTVVSAGTLYFEPHEDHVNDIVCPDKTSSCSKGTTCCQTTDGEYACCPMEDASCCPDEVHCCPKGMKCDLEHTHCISPSGLSVPWLTKTTASAIASILCPDKRSLCPTGSTCCLLQSGSYGCCPLPKAVCCPDHLHCCPAGAQCDTAHGRCLKDHQISIPWYTKLPAVLLTSDDNANNVESVVCPGGKRECPSGNTCCLGQGDVWQCCPMTKAVCCGDKEHCCPNGYKCDDKHATCIKSSTNNALPWIQTYGAAVRSVEGGKRVNPAKSLPSVQKDCVKNCGSHMIAAVKDSCLKNCHKGGKRTTKQGTATYHQTHQTPTPKQKVVPGKTSAKQTIKKPSAGTQGVASKVTKQRTTPVKSKQKVAGTAKKVVSKVVSKTIKPVTQKKSVPSPKAQKAQAVHTQQPPKKPKQTTPPSKSKVVTGKAKVTPVKQVKTGKAKEIPTKHGQTAKTVVKKVSPKIVAKVAPKTVIKQTPKVGQSQPKLASAGVQGKPKKAAGMATKVPVAASTSAKVKATAQQPVGGKSQTMEKTLPKKSGGIVGKVKDVKEAINGMVSGTVAKMKKIISGVVDRMPFSKKDSKKVQPPGKGTTKTTGKKPAEPAMEKQKIAKSTTKTPPVQKPVKAKTKEQAKSTSAVPDRKKKIVEQHQPKVVKTKPKMMPPPKSQPQSAHTKPKAPVKAQKPKTVVPDKKTVPSSVPGKQPKPKPGGANTIKPGKKSGVRE